MENVMKMANGGCDEKMAKNLMWWSEDSTGGMIAWIKREVCQINFHVAAVIYDCQNLERKFELSIPILSLVLFMLMLLMEAGIQREVCKIHSKFEFGFLCCCCCFCFCFAGDDDVFAWLMLMMFLMLMLLLAKKTLREVFEVHSKFEFVLSLLLLSFLFLFCW